MKPRIIESYYHHHQEYWKKHRSELRKLRAVYMARYWDKEQNSEITIETSRAYEFIEGYIASLFSRAPSVVVKADPRLRGNAGVVQELCNNFLGAIRSPLEDASRLALIYPCSFLKLIPKEHPDPFKRVAVQAIAPWDVIVDIDAHSWDDIKYVGHRYFLTKKEAQKKFGAKSFQTNVRSSWLDNPEQDLGRQPKDEMNSGDPMHFEYVELIEFYDLQNDKMYIWSPDYQNGEKFVYNGIDIVVDTEMKDNGETVDTSQKFNSIPFKDQDGYPISPIIPLYYSRQPDEPMRGYSALRRVYDQVQEVNILRTYQATMVRRTARQWVVKAGTFDNDEMARLALGVDGEYIEVDLAPGESLSGSIMAVPHTPVPPELERYVQQIQDDFERGSVLAPFTRGESSRATATEITALAAYSSSEIGRLARERDNVIERTAALFISILKLYISDDKKDSIYVSGQPEVITAESLNGDFGYYANDSGSTPVSEAVKKQEFLSTMPMLAEMGVPVDKLLQHLVQLLDLPQSFISAIEEATAQPPVATPAEAAQESSTGVQGQPSPDDVEQFLP